MDSATFKKITQWDPLIRFLEDQNPLESYNYCSSTGCPLAHFYRLKDETFESVTTTRVLFITDQGYSDEVFKLPQAFDEVASIGPWTYGSMLERAIRAKRNNVAIKFTD